MAGLKGCQGALEYRGNRRWRRGNGKRFESDTSDPASGLSSAISSGVSGRITITRRGRRTVVGSQPRSRKAAKSQRPRVRRAAFTGGLYSVYQGGS
jgi:hypothetical protein